MSLIPTMPLTYSYSYRVKDNASIKDRVNDMSVLRAKYMNPASVNLSRDKSLNI